MTTATTKETAALALLCDTEGIVRQVLSDGLETGIMVGQPFASILDDGSSEKCRAFLDTIHARGAAYDWEMNVSVGERIRLLRFSGSLTGHGIFLAAATTRSGITKIYEQFIRVEDNGSEASTPDNPTASPRAHLPIDGDSELYNELARLNNELVTIQRELIKRNVELERLNEVKNRFIGIAAHDLRNPLQVIEGYSEMLLEGPLGHLTPEQEKVIGVIRKSSDFMLKMITDLLHITKIEAGKLQLELKETDLANLLERNIELNRLLAGQKRINIKLTREEGIPPLRIDAPKIEQVLNNLITNAIKFSAPDTTVDVHAARSERETVITIRDEGQGIPADEIGRLFIPFENLSVKSTGGEQSTGLGLAIAKRIVEGHGGHIRVESEAGVGTTFTFSLPLN